MGLLSAMGASAAHHSVMQSSNRLPMNRHERPARQQSSLRYIAANIHSVMQSTPTATMNSYRRKTLDPWTKDG